MLLPKYLNPFRLVEYFTLSLGGGGGSSAPTSQNVTQTTIPEYARPYAETMLGKTAALTDINQNPYQPYQGQQVADLSALQQQAMGSIGGQQVSSQLGTATNLATQSGLGGLGAQQNAMGLQGTALGYGQAGSMYGGAASQFGAEGAQQAQNAAMQAQRQAAMYGSQGAQYGGQGAQYGAQGAQQASQAQRVAESQADMYGQSGAGFGAQAAGLAPEAQGYGSGAAQMGQAGLGFGALGAGIGQRGVSAAEQGFGAGAQYAQQATSPAAQQAYMSPYMQNVVDVQSQEARRQADISRQGQKSQATGQGAFGGSRSAIVQSEADRNLSTQLGAIQAQGSQNAFQQAQQAQQFGAGLGVQGLQAGYQGLQTGMQGTAQGIQGAQTGIQGQQAGMQGVGQAGQMYGLGMQGAGLGLQGTGQRLAAANVGLAGTGQGIQGAQAGMQGAGVGLSGVGQQLAGGQLGLSGAQTGIQGQQAGMQGAGVGLSGVQAATGAGQYGLQGLGTAGSAASTLGALGQTQYGQEMGISQAQMQAGALQQTQAQRGLDVAYQQYQDQLNYPYKQLAFQSDMFRGLPLSQSASTMYQNTGAAAPQLVGAGIAAYGASQRVKNGGTVKSYAEGGTTTVDPSVPSSIGPQALSSRLAKLSDEQLMAYARTVKDAVALAEVKGEIQRREEARQPQGQMPTGTVAQSMAPEEQGQIQPQVMAGGGIVALAGGTTPEIIEDASKNVRDYREATERQRLLSSELHKAGMFGYLTTPASERANARATLAGLQNAPLEDVRAYREFGVLPKSEDPLGGAAEVAGMADVQAREVERRQAEATQAQAEGAQMGNLIASEAQVRPAQQAQAQYAAETEAQVNTGNAQEGSGQYPNLSAPPGTAPVGIAAPGVTGQAPVAGAPAGQAPAGVSAAPANVFSSAKAPAAMATGAIPIANPGDPMGWGAYKASVEDAAKLDPEQKAVLDDMRKRSERKMARADKQEKNVFNESLIAGGLAMMGGLNLSDGVRRLAEGGGKKYFESSAEARKAIETADDAQSAFDQYQLSLKQGNKKVAAEMYGKFHNSMMDFNGKIQAASIGAAASREATAEAAKGRVQSQANTLADRQLARDDMMQRHAEVIAARKDEFQARLKQSGDTVKYQQMQLLDGRQRDLMAEARQTAKGVYDRFENRLQPFQYKMDSGKPLSPADQKTYDSLVTTRDAEIAKNVSPIRKQLDDVINRQGELMNIPTPSSSNAGGNGGFTLRAIK